MRDVVRCAPAPEVGEARRRLGNVDFVLVARLRREAKG
jgi:hypothetical protein